MKYISHMLVGAFFIAIPTFTAAPPNLKMIRQNLYENNPILFSQINEAVRRINDFAAVATLEELKNIQDYINFYRSWYQSVEPAPQSLHAALSPQARNLIDDLKKQADEHFIIMTTKQQSMIPGESKLSDNGNSYYQEILSELDSIITRNQQASRKYKPGEPLPQSAPPLKQ